MKKGHQRGSIQTVDECPQCTTPMRCGRTGDGKRGPRCVGRADGVDDCDCLNRCGDDPWLDKGKARPCERRAREQQAAVHRATAGPLEYASWFPIRVAAPVAELCHFPGCSCPMDPGPDPEWCARGLPHARSRLKTSDGA